jgi:hypothetical protein
LRAVGTSRRRLESAPRNLELLFHRLEVFKCKVEPVLHRLELLRCKLEPLWRKLEPLWRKLELLWRRLELLRRRLELFQFKSPGFGRNPENQQLTSVLPFSGVPSENQNIPGSGHAGSGPGPELHPLAKQPPDPEYHWG